MISREEGHLPSEYTFSLQAIGQDRPGLNAVHHFAPQTCRTTFKLLRTVPAYRSDSQISFQTEADPSVCSIRLIPTAPTPPAMLAPKPTGSYCQVCKEDFKDYHKHIKHPSHLRKLRLNPVADEISSLGDLLKKRDRRQRNEKKADAKAKKQVKVTEIIFERQESSSSSCMGSKKRMAVGERGDYESVNVHSSTTNDYEGEMGWDILGLDEPLRDYDAHRESWL